MNTQIIYFPFKGFHVSFMTLQSIIFKFFAKVIRGSCAFCCSSFKPTSHFLVTCRKEIINISSLITPCFTNCYFCGQYFNYKIKLDFSNEYIKLFFASTSEIWLLTLLFDALLWAKSYSLKIKREFSYAKIFRMQEISQNTVSLFLVTFLKISAFKGLIKKQGTLTKKL